MHVASCAWNWLADELMPLLPVAAGGRQYGGDVHSAGQGSPGSMPTSSPMDTRTAGAVWAMVTLLGLAAGRGPQQAGRQVKLCSWCCAF